MMRAIKNVVKRLLAVLAERISLFRLDRSAVKRINLCCGAQRIPGYLGIDVVGQVDLRANLAKRNLPFRSNVLESAICISAINYFTRERGQEIVNEVYRVLKPGGVARFAVQDLESIARRYVDRDEGFFFQRLVDGRERFEGPTLGDKFAAWFYGYRSGGTPCQYFYDYDSLAHLFASAGFSVVERREFRDSRLESIDLIDNRPDQMFFLEATK